MSSRAVTSLFGLTALWSLAVLIVVAPLSASEDDLAKRKAALDSGVPLVLVNANQSQADSAQGGKYIRYSETGNTARLETAIARFVRGSDGAIVDLIGVIHVADKAYYEKLNRRMDTYDAVLYEMVGGPYHPAMENMAQDKGAPLEGLAMIHGMIQNLLKLEYQKDGIDYTRKNFVHADVDWGKFQALSVEKNQTIATFFERAMKLAEDEDLPGIPKSEEESREVLSVLIGSVINGDSSSLKRTLAPVLSEAELLITKLEGEDGTVLVTERNKVALGVLEEQLRMGKKRLAVFYGAAHMPDLEKRLSAMGFHKAKSDWLTAWDIQESSSAADNNIFSTLLKDERIGGLLKSAMKLLNQARQPATTGK